MKAIIMAGGKGTRMRPLTCEIPKPMIPVMNKPLMEHIILLLKKHGITDIGVTLMYLPQKIKGYFGDGSRWGVRLTYFLEDIPLGTAGSLLYASSFLDGTFIAISGDCITDINLDDAVKLHTERKAIATMVLAKSANPLNYGIVTTNSEHFVTGFLEKPSRKEVFSDTVNTGIYVLEPDILKLIEPNRPFDFSRDLFPKLIDQGLPLLGLTASGYWSDVGSFESYMETHTDIMNQKVNLPSAVRAGSITIGKSTVIEPTASINGPCVIGSNCYIGHRAVIDSYSVMGDNCIIEDHATVRKSIVLNNSTVGMGSELRGSIVGRRVRLKRYVSCFENVFIGDGTIIHERSVIKPNIRIWPGKTVDSHSIVDRDVIWASRFNSTLFYTGDVYGTVNADITPEFASRLGSAYGSVLGRGKTVVVSSCRCGASDMFNYAFISGLMSVGVHALHLREIPIPLSRQAVVMLRAAGGIHVRPSEEFGEKLEISFFDETAAGINDSFGKNVENVFEREDFIRCRSRDIAGITAPDDFYRIYVRYLKQRINSECFKNNAPRLFLVSNCEFMLEFVKRTLTQLKIPIAGEMAADRLDSDRIRNIEHFIDADLVAFIDCSGEKLVLSGSNGKVLNEDQTFLLFAYILFNSVPGITVIAPQNMTYALEHMAKKYGGSVKRTGTSRHAILRELVRDDIYKNRISQYMLQYDATASLAKIIEYICLNRTTPDNLFNEIPSYYLEHAAYPCPYELIGRVMRILLSDQNPCRSFTDGLKINIDNSWVLITPDAQKPFIHLYTEGDSRSEAFRLLREYSGRIQSLIPVV